MRPGVAAAIARQAGGYVGGELWPHHACVRQEFVALTNVLAVVVIDDDDRRCLGSATPDGRYHDEAQLRSEIATLRLREVDKGAAADDHQRVGGGGEAGGWVSLRPGQLCLYARARTRRGPDHDPSEVLSGQVLKRPDCRL